MARGSRRKNRPVVPEALAALDRFKYEIANELNLPSNIINTGYWGETCLQLNVAQSADRWFAG